MEKEFFSTMAIDALGEMMNISLGSSATAVSNMLDHRVDITTPKVTVEQIDEVVLGDLEPAIGVEIKYVEGLEGSNIMLLKRHDIRVIVDILLGTETPEDEFELNELTISAVCEVMNQMMGAAATALSDFLGFPVNISTPSTFEMENMDGFRKEHENETLVIARFYLKIEDKVESEFMNVMSAPLAHKILSSLGMDEPGDAAEEPAEPEPADSNRVLSQEEIAKLMDGGAAGSAPESEAASGGSKTLSQEEIEKLMNGGVSAPAPSGQAGPAPGGPPQVPSAPPGTPGQMPPYAAPGTDGAPAAGGYPPGYPPMYYPPYPYPYPQQPDPKVINAQPLPMQEMVDAADKLGKEQAQNLELIMEVPLQVTVEIGRARHKVQDILEFTKGSLVVLDKLAGDQVDLFVNGKCIARGDVVVVEDNFGVRITEIIQNPNVEIISSK